jgi:hypothetical protein
MSEEFKPLRVKSADRKLKKKSPPVPAPPLFGQLNNTKKVAANGAAVRPHPQGPKGPRGATVRQPQQAHRTPARSSGQKS